MNQVKLRTIEGCMLIFWILVAWGVSILVAWLSVKYFNEEQPLLTVIPFMLIISAIVFAGCVFATHVSDYAVAVHKKMEERQTTKIEKRKMRKDIAPKYRLLRASHSPLLLHIPKDTPAALLRASDAEQTTN